MTSFDGDSFQGSCKVKLGPIALVYNGSGTFVEKDEAAHRFVVDAKGKDKRGNGTAGAKVTLSMDEGPDGTDVEVLTDLAITGKPAQFGRGVMQDVSDKLLGQFVACLESRLTGGAPEAPGEPAPVVEAASPEAAPSPGAPATSTNPGCGTRPRPTSQGDDSLDLGATVLPVLLKSYWKQGAAGLAVIAFIIWLIRRD